MPFITHSSWCRSVLLFLLLAALFAHDLSITEPARRLWRLSAAKISSVMMSILIVFSTFPFYILRSWLLALVVLVFICRLSSFFSFCLFLLPLFRCYFCHKQLACVFAICIVLLSQQFAILFRRVCIPIWPIFRCSRLWRKAHCR